MCRLEAKKGNTKYKIKIFRENSWVKLKTKLSPNGHENSPIRETNDRAVTRSRR